jgi:aspartyl-tRNA(Asn)/glutamyl-tRNA(Gln) amidotransferase subunit B
VSVRRPGAPLGTRCEIKNVNSIRFVGMAADCEARRQIAVIEDGGTIEQETRLYDDVLDETRAMRTKEEAHDYRYFPDPDLLPLELTADYVEALARGLPELPDQKKARYMAEFGLSDYESGVLVAEKETADHYDAMIEAGAPPKPAANWLINEYFGRLRAARLTVSTGPLTPAANSAIVQMVVNHTISSTSAKDVLTIVWTQGGDPNRVVEARGMKQVTDVSAIETVVDEIVAKNPDKVEQARQKPAAFGWFVGQVIMASGGKANPQVVKELLKAKLGL